MSDKNTFHMNAIGIIHSCFKEKFGIPRQPGLATEAKATLELFSPYNRSEAVEGLTQASHVWLQFIFHQSVQTEWKPTVRPPRLGGNKRMGVFATRSPVRPNYLGLSVVKLDGVDTTDGTKLMLSGVDLVDGTPVVDIKPYVPYVDSVAEATNQFADEKPALMPVDIPNSLIETIDYLSELHHVKLATLIVQVLQQDPRPQYQQLDESRTYGMELLNFNLRWQYKRHENSIRVHVLDIQTI